VSSLLMAMWRGQMSSNGDNVLQYDVHRYPQCHDLCSRDLRRRTGKVESVKDTPIRELVLSIQPGVPGCDCCVRRRREGTGGLDGGQGT
jgi:hypothetical protein